MDRYRFTVHRRDYCSVGLDTDDKVHSDLVARRACTLAEPMTLWQRLREFFGADPLDIEEAWDDSFPQMSDRELDCPDTQPTSPGLLDTLPGRLE
jgi:hypothetical protein